MRETTAAERAAARSVKRAARRLQANPASYAEATTPDGRFDVACNWFRAAAPDGDILDRAAEILRDLAVEADRRATKPLEQQP